MMVGGDRLRQADTGDDGRRQAETGDGGLRKAATVEEERLWTENRQRRAEISNEWLEVRISDGRRRAAMGSDRRREKMMGGEGGRWA